MNRSLSTFLCDAQGVLSMRSNSNSTSNNPTVPSRKLEVLAELGLGLDEHEHGHHVILHEIRNYGTLRCQVSSSSFSSFNSSSSS